MSEKNGCLFGWLASLLQDSDESDAGTEALPYCKREYFFSKAERSFFGVLQKSVGTDFILFAKVRLCDVVNVSPGTSKRQSYLNKISSKHVDFVLCDLKFVKPLLVIELDDSSHERADRQQRDELVDRILKAAQIPILRVAAKESYGPKDLRDQINVVIGVQKQ